MRTAGHRTGSRRSELPGGFSVGVAPSATPLATDGSAAYQVPSCEVSPKTTSFEDGPPPPVMMMWSPPSRTYPLVGEYRSNTETVPVTRAGNGGSTPAEEHDRPVGGEAEDGEGAVRVARQVDPVADPEPGSGPGARRRAARSPPVGPPRPKSRNVPVTWRRELPPPWTTVRPPNSAGMPVGSRSSTSVSGAPCRVSSTTRLSLPWPSWRFSTSKPRRRRPHRRG